MFRDVWPDRRGPLPWRLSQANIKELDRRASRTVWPHYFDPLYYDGCSFWLKPGRLWKTRRKVRVVHICIGEMGRWRCAHTVPPRTLVGLALILRALYPITGVCTSFIQGTLRFRVGTSSVGWPSSQLRQGQAIGHPCGITYARQTHPQKSSLIADSRSLSTGRLSPRLNSQSRFTPLRALCTICHHARTTATLLDVFFRKVQQTHQGSCA